MIGETIAYGPSTAREVVADWMRSRGHRRILLDKDVREAAGVRAANGSESLLDAVEVGSPYGDEFEPQMGFEPPLCLAQGSRGTEASGLRMKNFERFLAIGDFDGDGWGDLAASALLKDRPDARDSGVVQVLHGAVFADGFECGETDGW